MRTILLTLLLLVFLAGCAGKEDAPVDAAPAAEAAEETVTTEEPAPEPEMAEETRDDVAEKEPIDEFDLYPGPVGIVHLKNGASVPIIKIQKIGVYLIYVSGKLNGRSSSVISFTRLGDLKRWTQIVFRDKNNFTIMTKGKQQLHFVNSHLFFGSDSAETYSFVTIMADGYTRDVVTVNKADVKAIEFIDQPQQP